jgi:hypothetical protein
MNLSAAQKGTIYQRLNLLIDQECKLYEHYIKVVLEEGSSVTKLSVEKIKLLTHQREAILAEMNHAQSERQRLVSELGESPQSKLSEIVKKHYSRESSALLFKKIERLKKLVKQAQRSSSELNQVVSFSQRLANGCLAILASATNNVFRSYSPYGKIREAYHPSSAGRGMRRI